MPGTYTLELVQGQTFYDPSIVWKVGDVAQSFEFWTLEAQIRAKEDPTSTLVLDMSDYFTKAEDNMSLIFRLPGDDQWVIPQSIIKKGAFWDLRLVSTSDPIDPISPFYLLEGPVTWNPAVTHEESA